MKSSGRLFVVAVVVVSAACSQRQFLVTPDGIAPDVLQNLRLTRISGELGRGRRYEYYEGELRVPQNRLNPGGPVFELVFHRFPALPEAARDTPPIFLLNGGPGWPGFGRELENPAQLARIVRRHVRIADLIVVGQRGMGTSAPDTRCDRAPRLNPREPYDREARLRTLFETGQACREKWEDEGVDLQSISVIEAAHDVRDVAMALGYEQVQIQGGSFGSHWGMAVMRYHPDLVARAVLTGMEGPDHTYDMPGGILAALERVAADAAASGVYGDRVPPGGFIAGLRDVIKRADASPIRIEIPGRNPITVNLTADDIRGLSGGFSSNQSGHLMRAWPADMIRIYEGDFSGTGQRVIANRAGPLGFRQLGFPTAAYFMFDCGSGISGLRLEQLLSDPAAKVVGDPWWYQTTCPAWDADLGDGFRENFDTEIPTVVVHGNWDTSTPLENALELLPHFKERRFVLVVRGTHGALGEARNVSPKFRTALDEFIATGDMSRLPEVVTLPEVDWLPAPEP